MVLGSAQICFILPEIAKMSTQCIIVCMKFKVKDIKLAKQGKMKIAFAEKEMPVLNIIARDFKNASRLPA